MPTLADCDQLAAEPDRGGLPRYPDVARVLSLLWVPTAVAPWLMNFTTQQAASYIGVIGFAVTFRAVMAGQVKYLS